MRESSYLNSSQRRKKPEPHSSKKGRSPYGQKPFAHAQTEDERRYEPLRSRRNSAEYSQRVRPNPTAEALRMPAYNPYEPYASNDFQTGAIPSARPPQPMHHPSFLGSQPMYYSHPMVPQSGGYYPPAFMHNLPAFGPVQNTFPAPNVHYEQTPTTLANHSGTLSASTENSLRQEMHALFLLLEEEALQREKQANEMELMRQSLADICDLLEFLTKQQLD